MTKQIVKLILAVLTFILVMVLFVDTKGTDYKHVVAILTALGYALFTGLDLWDLAKDSRQQAEDTRKVKSKINEVLEDDERKLEILIPLLEDDTHEKTVDEVYQLSGPTDLLVDHLLQLGSNSINKVKNEEEIDTIRQWLHYRDQVNRRLSRRDRVAYIKENRLKIKTSLTNAKRYFEVSST